MSDYVLDASAMLAYLYNEVGAERVTEVLNSRAYIGAVNWAEVLSKVADKGHSTDELVQVLRSQGFIGNALVVLSTTEEEAEFIAKLRPKTKQRGLSLGDRACLALGLRLGLPVLTADYAWTELELDLSVQMIR